MGAGGRVARAADARAGKVEKGAPGRGVAPAAVGGLCDGAEVGFETLAALFCKVWGGDCGFEPGLAREWVGGRGANEGGEGLVEGCKVGVALLDDEGFEGQAECDVVEGEGFRFAGREDG